MSWMDRRPFSSAPLMTFNALNSGTNCELGDTGYGSLLAVKTMTACHSPNAGYSSVFDMSANADEWEDTCTTAPGTGMQDHCRTRGGSYRDSVNWVRCDSDWLEQPEAFLRSERLYTVGIRCCAP